MRTSTGCHVDSDDIRDMRYTIIPQPAGAGYEVGPTYVAVSLGSLAVFINQCNYRDMANFFERLAADMRAKCFETARAHTGAHVVTVTLEVSGDKTPPLAPALCVALDQCIKDSRAVHNSLRGNLVDHIRVKTTSV